MNTSNAEPPVAPAADSQDSRFVRYLLGVRRDNVTARSALRRGDTAALADRAVPYLRTWQFRPEEVDPALLFAAALCRYADIAHDPQTLFGRAAFRSLSPSDQREASETTVGRRIVATQRQALPLAHRQFTALLRSISDQPRLALDWTGLWRTYRSWDDPDPARRRRHRRRLLLDFYGTAPAGDDA